MNNFFGHLNTINKHKLMVIKSCFKAGLYKQGLLHDLSKYTPIEFFSGVKYYQGGERSPISKEKEITGHSKGWLHHKGRNKHHFEYWIDYKTNPHEGLAGVKMPKKYVAEMVIDRMSASKNYLKDNYTLKSPLDYFVNGKDFYVIDKDSEELTEYLLTMLKDKGEDYLLKYIKNTLLKNKDGDYHFENGELILH
ncbi:DUF5662 family protein [Anaerofustis sp.]|uniref:DUF5662 family protein n=1 Tax=Anaerofustis sp. TaxID=1872517 RepID=UPI0025C09DAB|nr:DUF5662 family protein [Anaerofustis sp.]